MCQSASYKFQEESGLVEKERDRKRKGGLKLAAISSFFGLSFVLKESFILRLGALAHQHQS